MKTNDEIGASMEPLRKQAAAPQDWQDAVAEAAQARAAGYEGDDRKDIKTDVFNAFANGADWERRRAALAATQPAAQGMEADLTDAQIDEAFNQMPDGAAGFLKSWGYRQFARAVLAAQAKQGGA